MGKQLNRIKTVLAEQGEDAAYATVREAVKADRRDRRAKRSAR